MILPVEMKREIQSHARECYPEECVGLIRAGAYERLKNVSEDPESFAWSPELDKALIDGTLEAVVHSHTCHYDRFNRHDCPTWADMQMQVKYDVPFILCATNGEAVTDPFSWGGDPVPLDRRPFRHGVTDCYSLVRDWYRIERNIVLPEYPRSWDWWNNGANLYEEGFDEAGFVVRVDNPQKVPADAEPGDLVFFKLRSSVTNHAGVFIGDGKILHHATPAHAVDKSRLPCEVLAGRWISHCTRWLRYEGHG